MLWISVAGGLGALVRFIFEYLVRERHPTQRPWATVAANALGCGLAGFVAYGATGTWTSDTRSVVLTGFCGGLTTFSSAFAIPALLRREHHWRYAAALLVTTPLACTATFLVGMQLAK